MFFINIVFDRPNTYVLMLVIFDGCDKFLHHWKCVHCVVCFKHEAGSTLAVVSPRHKCDNDVEEVGGLL